MLRNERASTGNDGIGGGCTTLQGCSRPIECDATGRKSPQQDRSHKLWREANGGAQCGKSARCVRRGGGWRRGVGRDPGHTGAPALDPTDERGWETERCRMAQATAPILDSTNSDVEVIRRRSAFGGKADLSFILRSSFGVVGPIRLGIAGGDRRV